MRRLANKLLAHPFLKPILTVLFNLYVCTCVCMWGGACLLQKSCWCCCESWPSPAACGLHHGWEQKMGKEGKRRNCDRPFNGIQHIEEGVYHVAAVLSFWRVHVMTGNLLTTHITICCCSDHLNSLFGLTCSMSSTPPSLAFPLGERLRRNHRRSNGALIWECTW